MYESLVDFMEFDNRIYMYTGTMHEKYIFATIVTFNSGVILMIKTSLPNPILLSLAALF